MTHPDPDVLAEFHAGLITGRHGARVAEHLADCERCTALSGQLAEVSALLAAVPAPAMPPQLAHRLDTVLATEAAQRKEQAEQTGVTRSPSRASRPRWDFRLVAQRVLAPAAVVLLLAAGGYGLTHLGGRPTASGTSAGPASAPSRSSLHVNAPANGSRAAQGANPEAAPSIFDVTSSGVDYEPATLRQQVAALMRGSPTAATLRPATAQTRACAFRLTGGAEPARVDLARYQGQSAIVVVLAKGSSYQVWVVGTACSATSSHQLAYATVPPGM